MDSIIEFIFNLLETLATWVELRYYRIRGEAARIQRRLDGIRPQVANFWRNTVLLAIIAIVIPFILFVVGIIFKQRWLLGTAGLAATIGHGIIFFVFAGLGDVITLVIQWAKPSTTQSSAGTKSASFIKVAETIILAELIAIGYTIIVPVWNNLSAIPVILMISVMLVLMVNVWDFKTAWFKYITFGITVASFCYFTASFYIPKSAAYLEENTSPKIDDGLLSWLQNPHVPSIFVIGGLIALVILLIHFLSKTSLTGTGSKWLKNALILVVAVGAIYFLWPYAKALASKTFGSMPPAIESYTGSFDSSKAQLVLDESLSPRAPFDHKYDLPKMIKKGDIIAVEVNGNYIWDPAADGYVGPCGASWTPKQLSYKAKFPILDYGIAGIVLKIGQGGYVGLCGSGQRTFNDRGTVLATFRALEDSGSLTIALNERWDSAAYGDNSGTIQVRGWVVN